MLRAFAGLWLAAALLAAPCGGQTYPRWFLQQGEVRCAPTWVGYARPSAYYPDSAAASAARNAGEAGALWTDVLLTGGQAFWSTEIGTFWMGSSIHEEPDSSAVAACAGARTPLAVEHSPSMTVAIVADAPCSLSAADHRRVDVRALTVPRWTEQTPSLGGYHLAVGTAPEYYYEISSWLEAEQRARLNLAREVLVSLRAVQKVDWEGQEVRNEELSVRLRGVEVVSRWRDARNRLFFVLVRMRQQSIPNR